MSDENTTVVDIMEDAGSMDAFDDLVYEGDFDVEESSEESDGEIEASSEDIDDSDSSDSIGEEGEGDSEAESEDDGEAEEDSDEAPDTDEEAERDEKEEVEEEKEPEEKGINDDAEIEVKVDGKVEKVSLKELKNNYAGKVAYDKKFTELDKERQAYKSEVQEVNGYVNKFGEIARSGDMIGALQYLGEFAQIPPYMVKEQLLQQALPELLKRQDMAPHEVQQEILKNQQEYLNKQQESVNEKTQQEQAYKELRAEISSLREAHKIEDDAEWDSALQTLAESVEDQSTINPKMIAEAVLEGRRVDTAIDVLTEFGLQDEEESVEYLANLQSTNPEFTSEQLKEVVKLALQQEEAQKKVQEVAAKAKKQKVAKKAAPKKKETASEEDEIDPLLADWL